MGDGGAAPTSRPPPPRPRPGAPRVVILAGPTGVGKTAVSVALAGLVGGEIVNADSVAVYRGCDVGAAKPTPAERAAAPHHLLDVLDPGVDFSAGDFYGRARAAIADIVGRGRVPIVVGGTGLYLRWLVHGKPATPPPDPASSAAARAAVDAAVAAAEAAAGRRLDGRERWDAAVGALAAAGDEASAATISKEVNNEYRLLRALAVVLATGGPRAAAAADARAPLDYDFRAFFLHADRVAVYRRIDARAEAMLACGGLVGETAAMLAAGLRTDGSCALRAIGYRQAAEAIETAAAARDERTRADDAPAPPSSPPHPRGWGGLPYAPPTPADGTALWGAVAAASRRLAHAQYTWFRGDPLYKWLDVGGRPPASVAADVAAAVATPVHDPGGGDGGRLSAGEADALKRYVPRLTVLADDAALAGVAASVAAAADGLPDDVRAAAAASARARVAARAAQRERSGARDGKSGRGGAKREGH